ncbi:MAG: hypothetical protein KKH28_15390 [Elusimicrobia bacterium]|nr:hypothetical protein [Elusimicrobiota bacterium]
MDKYLLKVGALMLCGAFAGCSGPMTLVKANKQAYDQMNKLEARGYTVEVAKGAPRQATRSDDNTTGVEKAQMESCEAARANGENALVKRIIGYSSDGITGTENLALVSADATTAVKERLSLIRPFFETNTVENNCVMVIGMDPAAKKELKNYIGTMREEFFSPENAPPAIDW